MGQTRKSWNKILEWEEMIRNVKISKKVIVSNRENGGMTGTFSGVNKCWDVIEDNSWCTYVRFKYKG